MEWLNEGHPVQLAPAGIGHSVKVQRDEWAHLTDGHLDHFGVP